MEQTRELILERAVELLGDPAVKELTVAEAAARAGVSVRTAYRYFPTKEALFDGVNEWFMRRWGPSPRYPDGLDQLPAMVTQLYQSFHDNEALMRAALRARQNIEVRARRKQQQARALTRIVENDARGLDAAEVRRAACAIHAVVSADHYLNLRETWGLSVEEATRTAVWAIETIAARVRRKKEGK